MRWILAVPLFVLAACGGGPPGSGYLVYVRDRQGSVVAAVDDQGQKIWETHDDAFGLRLSSTGREIPRDFLDQPFDDETGFYQFHYRTYDPATAQWLAPDPMLISNQEYCTKNPELCNPYAYGGDRPGEWPDPDGREVHVELSESSLTVHGTLAVYGCNSAQVVTAIQEIQSKVLQGTGNRIDVVVHIYDRRDQIPAGETPIDATISAHDDRSETHSDQSLVDVGADVHDPARASRVLWHEILHLTGARDEYVSYTSSIDGKEHSASVYGEERSYMGDLRADKLELTPAVKEQIEYPDPADMPNQGLNLTPGCGTIPMDGDVSRPSQP
jgi:RHS repeat-associated protein